MSHSPCIECKTKHHWTQHTYLAFIEHSENLGIYLVSAAPRVEVALLDQGYRRGAWVSDCNVTSDLSNSE